MSGTALKVPKSSQAVVISENDTLQALGTDDFFSWRTWTIPMARNALAHIDPDCAYEVWRNVASAIIGQFGKDDPDTFRLFDDWSKGTAEKPAQKYNPRAIREQYAGFEASTVTMGSVEWRAKKGGWKPTSELLNRLTAMSPRSVGAPGELLTEVAAERLSSAELELYLEELRRVTGIGKTALKQSIKEIQRELARNHGGQHSGREPAAVSLVKLGRECELWEIQGPPTRAIRDSL